ncbi:hypothetical protein PFISCL1PPCAC_22609, partial [Pristionchus fissidentatus]
DATDRCKDSVTYNLADMDNVLSFDGQATCSKYEKIYQFNPDPKSKSGHLLTMSSISGRSYLNFAYSEFTLDSNGTIDRIVFRPAADYAGTKTWFAPETGILVNFTRNGGYSNYESYSFASTISETAAHHHCPFPFIDLQPGAPVVLQETFILYRCDALITAPDGFEVRLDHILDTTANHEMTIKVYDVDSEKHFRWYSYPVEETMLGSGPIRIEIDSRSDFSHQVEIQLSAVEL